MTNDTRNNLIAYSRTGKLIAAWETRFPGAHGLDIVDRAGIDEYWIADHVRQMVSVCSVEGEELLRVGPDAVASKYPDLTRYRPTSTCTLADGDFYVADGYGSSLVHHFDPKGRLISSFGGEGDAPEMLRTPHSVWIDYRSKKPQLLVCDREHNMLKWFSTEGELLRVVNLGATTRNDEPIGAGPCNVAQFSGRLKDYLAIACIRGMILILDGRDRIVASVGGEPVVYRDGKLETLETFNYTFNHPHDVYVDSDGALYVAQWYSNQTYPIKLEPVAKSS